MMEIDVNQELKIKFEAGSIKGEDGITPHIGDNGNWYVGGTDTGVQATGERGEPGQPGYTPVKGKDYFDGQPGQPGKDGISPVINVTDIENGHRVTITTGSDVQSFDVVDGKDGKSAVSPTVSVTEIEGGHRVTINSEGKTDSFDVMNGKDGENAEGGTVEVDPTLTIEGMAADAKATGDAIKAIGSGGGAQVQSDYTQHDPAAPDYIKNRPFWPAWSPVLVDIDVDYDGGMAEHVVDAAEDTLTAPSDGERYTFCVNGKIYTGIAARTTLEFDESMSLQCIMIADEQDGSTMACFVENIENKSGWIVILSDPAFAESGTAHITIVEGAPDAHAKLSVPEDVIASQDGMNLVYHTTNKALFLNDYVTAAFISGTEIVVDENGVETVYAGDEIEIDLSGQIFPGGFVFMCGGHMAAVMMQADSDIMVALIDENAMSGTGFTAKSIKVNYPGIFAKTIPGKKLHHDSVDSKPYIVYIKNSDFLDFNYISMYKDEGCTEYIDVVEFEREFQRGIPIYFCVSLYYGDEKRYYSPQHVRFDYTNRECDSVYFHFIDEDGKIHTGGM